MVLGNEKVVVLYGSQTGNAQDVAEGFWRASRLCHFRGPVLPMNDYHIRLLPLERCAIFVCSTTGQGDEPDNMNLFWKFLLRRNLPSNFLSNLRFAVLGLGDSSYAKFNFAAKRLHKRLSQLGAEPLLPIGLADDQHDCGYDAVVEPWSKQLWAKLLELYPLPKGVEPLDRSSVAILPRWNVSWTINENTDSESVKRIAKQPSDFAVKVLENARTTSPACFKDVRLIQFKTNGEPYSPGDVLVIKPKNSLEQIKCFVDVLEDCGVKIPRSTRIKVTELTKDMPVPKDLQTEVTFSQLCWEYFDLSCVPRRRIFEVLAHITDSPLEKEKCTEFTSAEGLDDFYSYCNRVRRNIVEVLQDFPHATKNLTLDLILEIMTPIKPREFSIASSHKQNSEEVHILVAVVMYKTNLVKNRFGLCSNYLADLKAGDELCVSFKKGSFNFPESPDAPVVMVGPGTGVAPFVSYIFEREALETATADSLTLFFGCTNSTQDFHFRDQFLRLQRDRKLNLICAFSREQEHKIYVQHRIEENSRLMWDVLQNGYVLVAGSSKNMPQQVRQAFLNVCMERGGMGEEEAAKLIERLERTGKYQTETWS